MAQKCPVSDAVYTARLEKIFHRVLAPLNDFIQQQITGSVLLIVCAGLALFLANSPWGESYLQFLHEDFSLTLSGKSFSMSLLHWINDALMTLFFLLMGMELKRELLVGELASFRRALLPIIAACGGMIVPALLYFSLNPNGIAAAGWGISMATDIAFAVGVLSLLGTRVPKSLFIFLIALAIVDDLGAVLVIAIFYTQTISPPALLLCAGLTGILVLLNLGGIQRILPYMLLGIFLWCAMLSSGVHATIAGVILAFCIPIRPKSPPEYFVREVSMFSQELQKNLHAKSSIQMNEALQHKIAKLEKCLEQVQAPAQRLESSLHVYVTYLVVPIFALANAAVPITLTNLKEQASNPIILGVVSGLLLGKLVGITGATWLAVKSGKAALPDDLRMRHIIGVGLLGGIGFTMSIFVADLGFSGYPHELLMAKTGILLASILAGISGFLWLYFFAKSRNKS